MWFGRFMSLSLLGLLIKMQIKHHAGCFVIFLCFVIETSQKLMIDDSHLMFHLFTKHVKINDKNTLTMETSQQKADLFVIALDGPAGSGKSTIAKQLSQMLKIEYIDSGAIYRTFTLYGINTFNGQCQGKEQKIAEHFKSHPDALKIEYENHTQKMILKGM